MAFAHFDFLAFVVDTIPEKTRGYNYGAQHLQLFTEPIPRALWRGKPFGAPVTLIDWNRFGNTLGITVSVVGDGWISYGWVGVAINMLLYGTVLALLYNWFILHQNHVFRSLIGLLVFSILVQVFRDGSFVTIAKFLLFTMFPILLWWSFHKFLFNDEIEPSDEVKSM
jgi:oligosaccharide repeat unit polymerase